MKCCPQEICQPQKCASRAAAILIAPQLPPTDPPPPNDKDLYATVAPSLYKL